MARRTLLVGLASLALVASCAEESRAPGTPSPSPLAVTAQDVTADFTENGVQIFNGGTTGISYLVVKPNWLGLLAPCVGGQAQCPTLAPGATVSVPAAQIHGYEANAATLHIEFWLDGAPVGDRVRLVLTR